MPDKIMSNKYPTNEKYEELLKEIAKNIKLLPELREMAEKIKERISDAKSSKSTYSHLGD